MAISGKVCWHGLRWPAHPSRLLFPWRTCLAAVRPCWEHRWVLAHSRDGCRLLSACHSNCALNALQELDLIPRMCVICASGSL